MQVIENIAGHGSKIWLTLAGTLMGALLLVGCENPGSVGSGFLDADTRVITDTLQFSDLQEQSFDSWSGDHDFFSVGEFNDPLFGNLRSVGYLKPTLPGNSAENDFLSDAEMKLQLHIDQQEVYGDSNAAVQYDVMEVGELWRGVAMTLEDRLALDQSYTVGSFTAGKDETVTVDLSGSFVDRYREFYLSLEENRDSLYRYSFFGLALVPRDSGKMIPIDVEDTQFLVYNPGLDTLNFGLSSWAYSLERTNRPDLPAGRTPVHSTLENVFSFDLQALQEAVGSVNLSRVELVIYEDSVRMDNTLDQVSASSGRPDVKFLRLHRVEKGTTPEALDPGSALARGAFNPKDAAFHFNITDFVRTGGLEASTGFDFYITGPAHNGIIRSSLIFNNEAPAERRPKLIVTSIQTTEN